MPLPGNAQPGLRIYRLNPHGTHQAADTLMTELVAQFVQLVQHPVAAVGRLFHVNPVDLLHQQLVPHSTCAAPYDSSSKVECSEAFIV
jgi:hypothetical protein